MNPLELDDVDRRMVVGSLLFTVKTAMESMNAVAAKEFVRVARKVYASLGEDKPDIIAHFDGLETVIDKILALEAERLEPHGEA